MVKDYHRIGWKCIYPVYFLIEILKNGSISNITKKNITNHD